MNKALIVKIIGLIMMIEAALMLLPMIVSALYKESSWSIFLAAAAGTAIVGAALFFLIKPKKNMLLSADGFIITAAAWVILAACGAVPFCLSGAFSSYLEAFFETVAGFTTTGITILADVTVLDHGMLFWRSLTHWIGGMGVLVFMLALAPVAGGGTSLKLLKAESPGPFKEKLTPKISQGAKWLYIIYIAMTLVQTCALMIAGMSAFNSLIVTFGTVATGGFAYLNTSLATLTMAQQIIVEIFMLLAGINFGLIFMVVTGRLKHIKKNEEFRWYLIITFVAAAIISIDLISNHIFTSAGETIHHAIFGSISSITSTGYSSTDMNLWPWYSKGIMILLMYIGGCSGSTAGGIKVSRFIILVKTLRRYVTELAHPRSVNEIKYNDKKLSPEVVKGTLVYFCLIVVISVVSILIVSIDPEMDFSTSFASVATTINNNGIDFHGVSVGGYGTFQWYTKIIYIIDMIIGRLEIFPVIILINTIFSPIGKLTKHVKRKTASV